MQQMYNGYCHHALKPVIMQRTGRIILPFIVIVLLCTGFYACKKKSDNLVADALIVDGGDPVTFGCGWLIKIGNELKYDNDLPVNFRQDSLPVKLSYKELGTQYTCLRNPPPQPINNIRIIQIITR
jgi:hypothetical protein